jgi:hypothetical protein
MANLLSSLFSRQTVTRITLSEYIRLRVQAVENPFSYAAAPPVMTVNGRNIETIEDSYTSLAQYAYRGDSVVAACMRVRRDLFRQAKFTWRELGEAGPGKLFRTDDLRLLEHPWPNGTTGELLTRMITDVDLCGNSFLANEGERLRWLRPDWMSIVLSGDPLVDPEIDVLGYVYTPGGSDPDGGTPYKPDEICHWSPEQDPLAFYRGMSWVSKAIEDIQGDRAATTHKLAFFRNGAVLGPIVRVPAGMSLEQFKDFVAAAEAAHTGADKAYKTMYVGGGAEVTLAAADFRQLDLKSVQGGYETRIAAVAGVHPVLVGLSEGLAGSSLNSGNFAAARRATAEMTLFSLWQDLCGALSAFFDVPDGAEMWIRERDIPFLREERKDQAEITKTKMLTIEAGVRAGYKPDALVDYAETDDVTVLKGQHTGLTSVQLLPPGEKEATPTDFGALRDEPVRALAWVDEDEIVSRALADAIDELSRDRYDVRIPGGNVGGGRFRKLSDTIFEKLKEWLAGEGEDDPLAEYSKEQLRRVAKERGLLKPRERVSEDQLKLRLYKDIRERGGKRAPDGDSERPEPAKKAPPEAAPAKKAAPKARFDPAEVAARVSDQPSQAAIVQLLAGDPTLTSAKLRKVADELDIDVPDGMRAKSALQLHIAEKVARDRDLPSGFDAPPAKKADAPKADTMLVFDNDQQKFREIPRAEAIEGYQRYLKSKFRPGEPAMGVGEERLAKMAKGEDVGGEIPYLPKPKKAALRPPAKKAVPKAATLSSDPKIREIQAENLVRERIAALRGRTDLPEGGTPMAGGETWQRMLRRQGHVSLADLRESLPDLSREEFDATVRRLSREDGFHVYPQEAQGGLRPVDRTDGVEFGGQMNHWIQVDREDALTARPLPKRTPAKKAAPAATGHAAIDAQARAGWKPGDKLTHKNRGPVTYIGPDEQDPVGLAGGGSAQWVEFDDGTQGMVSANMLSGYVPPAKKAAPDLEQKARDRQAKIDTARGVADTLAELDQITDSEASPRAVESRLRSAGKRNDLPAGVVDDLIAAAGDRKSRDAAVARLAGEHGLVPGARAGTVEAFDPAKHQMVGGGSPEGTHVRVVRPGYEADVDGERVRLSKATVSDATPGTPDLPADFDTLTNRQKRSRLRQLGFSAEQIDEVAPLASTEGTDRRSRARDISREVDYDQLGPTYNLERNRDDALADIITRQGFDARPVVVSRADFDDAVSRGEVRETWRGLKTPARTETYRTGDFYAGNGINGNGSYVAMRKADAQIYGPVLLRIGLRRDARVISADDLDAEMDRYFAGLDDSGQSLALRNLEQKLIADLARAKTSRTRANIRRKFRSDVSRLDRDRLWAVQRDPGRFAALRGYDAIEIPKERSPDKHAEIIILNRGATIVEEAQ